MTSGFGWRWGKLHAGIDIAAPVGTPLVAANCGRIAVNGWDSGGYGNFVVITHGDGSETYYGHLNTPGVIPVGQIVKRGQYIGPMGSTGRSTGPHTHFEYHPRAYGPAVDPLLYIR